MSPSTTASTPTAGNSSPKRRSKSPAKPASPGKNKGKNTAVKDAPPRVEGGNDDDDEDEEVVDDEEEEEDDDEDEDDDDEDEDEVMDEDDEEEDEAGGNKERIDPKAILAPGTRRSTRGNKIDYSSAEALQRAGLKLKGGEPEVDDVDMH